MQVIRTSFLLAALLAASLASCHHKSGSATPPLDASGSVGVAGGVVTVTGSNSPLAGGSVVVPAGAVPSNTLVRIEMDHAATGLGTLPSGVVAAGPVVKLTKDMADNFQLPVKVTVPYDKTKVGANDVLVVVYWDPTYLRYFPVGVREVDAVAGRVSFATAHFTEFETWVVQGLAGLIPTIDTGFRPSIDGFHDHNFGAYDSPGGSCLGMANYSTWYYANKKAVDGTVLYQKYAEGDPNNEDDDRIQHEVISRAFMASSQIWANVWTLAEYQLGDTATGLMLLATMYITGQPQTMLLRTGAGGHAVVVYAYDPTTELFAVYDNNFPNEVVNVGWSLATGFHDYSKAAAYNGITQVGFEAFSTFLEASQFEGIYEGGESGFQDSKFVQIAITAPVPEPDGSVHVPAGSTENVAIDGTATGGILPATNVVLKINGTRKNVFAIDASGVFHLSIPPGDLPNPVNTIALIATNSPNNEWYAYAGYEEVRVVRGNFFANLGFETGGFDSWNHETHTWQNQTPGSYPFEKSAVVGQSTDPISNFVLPYRGSYACRVNNSDSGYHISSVSQTATVPNGTNVELKFYWAAVLEDPDHDPANQPFVDVQVYDETTSTPLYTQHFYSNDPAYSGWLPFQNGGWKAIPWQVVVVDVTQYAGHQLTLRVIGGDCGYGAHGGYVYIDGDE